MTVPVTFRGFAVATESEVSSVSIDELQSTSSQEDQVPQRRRRRVVKQNKGHSGIQKQVLKLYRDILVAAKEKSPEGRQSIINEARRRFKANMLISRKEFGRIEHLIRMGEKQLATVRTKGFDGITTVKVSH